MKPHIDKKLLRISGLAEKNLLAFIEDGDLVETVVSGLRSLVDGDGGGDADVVGVQTEIFAEFDGVGRVETTGGVVPALERSAGEGGLGNSYSFSLAT